MFIIKPNIPQLLRLVKYQDPVLRRVISPVNFPLSVADVQLILDMKYSIQTEQLKRAQAPFDAASGMAANQWGIQKRIFLFCPEGDEKIETIINPSYTPLNKDTENQPAEEFDWEGCFSVPLKVGYVKRYLHIQVTYQNEAGEALSRELSGWLARVWQHETDHLNGVLFDDPNAAKCHEIKHFSSKQEYYDLKF
jgi:peptide deformylase